MHVQKCIKFEVVNLVHVYGTKRTLHVKIIKKNISPFYISFFSEVNFYNSVIAL